MWIGREACRVYTASYAAGYGLTRPRAFQKESKGSTRALEGTMQLESGPPQLHLRAIQIFGNPYIDELAVAEVDRVFQ